MTTSDLRSLRFTVKNTSTRRVNSVGEISAAVAVSSQNITAKMVLNLSTINDQPYEFVFPFAPIDVQYSNLATEWTEINRPGRTPLIDYSQNRLLEVSFNFLVARPNDGLAYSVDDDLVTLRYMAASTRTVSVFGMDGMLTNPFQIPGQPARTSSGFFFHITDLSIRSVRRNKDNHITAAECSITLREVNNPDIGAVRFPPIQYPPQLPPVKKKTPKYDDPHKQLTSYQRLAMAKLADQGVILTVEQARTMLDPNTGEVIGQ